MTLFIIILTLIILFWVVIAYFFRFTFVRKKAENLDDINAPCNDVLGEFREYIGGAMARVKAKEWESIETVSFDGKILKARYLDNGFKNTALLFHGYRSSALRDMSCAVELYSSLGFNILLADQRSHGESEGRLITFGVKEKRDVIVWADLVNRKFSPEKILLDGMSMGATTVLLAAGERDLPENIRAVIGDCGFTSPVEIITTVAKKQFKINGKIFIPFLNFLCKIFGKFSITEESTEASLKNCKIPVLLIHGEADGFVPCEMSRKAFKSCNEKSLLLTVKNAHHGMSYLVDRELVYRKIKDFLIQNI